MGSYFINVSVVVLLVSAIDIIVCVSVLGSTVENIKENKI